MPFGRGLHNVGDSPLFLVVWFGYGAVVLKGIFEQWFANLCCKKKTKTLRQKGNSIHPVLGVQTKPLIKHAFAEKFHLHSLNLLAPT